MLLKALAIVVVIILTSMFATAYSTPSGRLITLQTDSSHYHIGDALFISGRATYNDGAVQSRDVAVSLQLTTGPDKYYPKGNLTTDVDGRYNATFTFPPIATLGTYIVLATVTIADQACSNQTTVQLTDTITIKANGEIDAPPNTPISRSGGVYNLTGSITGNSANGIVIQSNSIILDGAGFTLNGKGLANSNGIYLASVSNVTIENISIESFQDGVNQYYSPNCHIVDTNLFSNGNGIYYQQASSNTIEGNNITGNTYAGIELDGSNNNNISGNSLSNTISSNFGAISIRGASYGNSIVNNNFVDNTLYGVYIEASYSNSIFHNNFFNNARQGFVTPDSSGNKWDDGYLSGGNYWSDYAGVDIYSGPNQNLTGSDGIGDTPYTINATTHDIDHYPLMNTWNPIAFDVTTTGNQVPSMMTNTTITDIGSTPNTLNFTASGASGTGYVLVIIPLGLNSTNIQVRIDGGSLSAPYPIITTDGTDYFVYFEFGLSSHQITLIIAAPGLPVPAVPLGTLTAAVAMILVLAGYFMISKRKRARAEMPDPEPSRVNCAPWTSNKDGGASSSEQN